MTDMRLVEAYRDLDARPEQRERVWRRLEAEAAELGLDTERPLVRPLRTRRLRRSLFIAAVLASLLTVTAYAAEHLGLGALLIPGGEEEAFRFARQADGSRQMTAAPEGGLLSLSQPQELPPELPEEKVRLIEASRAAWEDWESWRPEHMPQRPEVFIRPEGAEGMRQEPNADGGATLTFYRLEQEENGGETERTVEVRQATAEELAADRAYTELMGKLGIEGYDYSYGVFSREMADYLEALAARAGLELRRERTVLTQAAETSAGGENELPPAALLERLSRELCSGPLFREAPDLVDHACYFQEGSFALSYSVYAREGGGELVCYGYNSPYGTLSSGREVFEIVPDRAAFTERSHTAPDGTELTVLSDGANACFYAWLEDSWYAQYVHSRTDGPVSDGELDRIMDAICYTHIGK